MPALAIDLGATKLSMAVFSEEGGIIVKTKLNLNQRKGKEVGDLIVAEMGSILRTYADVNAVGVAVPGIYRHQTGTVWAPNIAGWDDYPLLQQMRASTAIPITIDSDRAAYILGESWLGNAKGCRNAIYLAIGTGIGAGILIDGKILRGEHDIAGAIGWMALRQPFEEKYASYGCFEYHASGDGVRRVAEELIRSWSDYAGPLKKGVDQKITTSDVFDANEQGDPVAKEVFTVCISLWGMAVANLVSLFNPEKIILGGGVFGPGIKFIPAIIEEAKRWAQPISMTQVIIEPSLLGNDAGLYGAAFLAWQQLKEAADIEK